MLSVVTDEAAQAELALSLDELAREGARRMLAAALEAEVDAYIAAFAALVDERGHRLVRRNGHAPARKSPPGSGRSRSSAPGWTTGGWTRPPAQRQQFHSQILPRWCRRSPEGGRGAAAAVPARAAAPATSSRPWRSCSARRRACRPR